MTTGMQQHRVNTAIEKKHASASHKRTTTILAEERKKPKGRSAQNVCDQIEREYGVKLSRHTLNRYFKDGNIGSSPLRNGFPGTIPEFVFKNLCTAIESYMKINQLNGQSVENSRKNLHNRVMKVMGKEENIVSTSLLNRILQATAVEIFSTLTTNIEERRTIWTTYNNLKSWFDNWEHDLEDLGFAERDEEGNLYIPVEQLSRIINVDKSCLSLDGINRQRGGRPEVVC